MMPDPNSVDLIAEAEECEIDFDFEVGGEPEGLSAALVRGKKNKIVYVSGIYRFMRAFRGLLNLFIESAIRICGIRSRMVQFLTQRQIDMDNVFNIVEVRHR